jgi:hypothetical protein
MRRCNHTLMRFCTRLLHSTSVVYTSYIKGAYILGLVPWWKSHTGPCTIQLMYCIIHIRLLTQGFCTSLQPPGVLCLVRKPFSALGCCCPACNGGLWLHFKSWCGCASCKHAGPSVCAAAHCCGTGASHCGALYHWCCHSKPHGQTGQPPADPATTMMQAYTVKPVPIPLVPSHTRLVRRHRGLLQCHNDGILWLLVGVERRDQCLLEGGVV